MPITPVSSPSGAVAAMCGTPYGYHGHEFAHRTYYEHGRAYDHFYRGYTYHGAYIEMYAPILLLSRQPFMDGPTIRGSFRLHIR